jgi:cytochrome c-type biogenesis protein CcmH
MLAKAPADAAWAGFVREALARVSDREVVAQRGPSADDVAAASQLTEEQRGEMIRGMVAGLAERLKNDGSDVDGWLRLLRAYMVLGDREKARSAAADARRALASDPDKLRRVEDMVKGLGLDG